MEGENLEAAPAENISINSKIAMVNTRFHIHEIIKKSNFSTHCVAEDLEVDPASTNVIMYYFLKQNIYTNQAEFQHALTYYQKLQSYCKQPLAKADIIKLYNIFHAEDAETNTFELVLLFELGEADRIDIDQIQVQQITKFLKNVCILLQDLKSKVDLYEGNICIKNIVLTENELKISGFKPIFVNNPDYQTWKTDLCKKYSPYRLDLYMIGLIWLRMLGSNVEEVTKTGKNIDDVSSKITQKYESLPEEKKTNIVAQFLDLNNRPELNLDDAILLFDEYFIIETRKLMEIQKNQAKNQNTNREFDGGSVSEDGRGSIGQSNFDSNAKDQNPFSKGLNDSGIDNVTFKNDDPERKATDASGERMRGDTNFTMADNQTFHPDKNYSVGNLIEVQDQQKPDKRQSEITPSNRENSMAVPKKNLLPGSEKRLSKPEGDNENSMGSFKNVDSYGSIPLNDNTELFDEQGNPRAQPVSRISKNSAPSEISGDQPGFSKKKSPQEIEEEQRNSLKPSDSKGKDGLNARGSKGSSNSGVKVGSAVNKDSFVEMGQDSDKNLANKDLNDNIDKVANYMDPKQSRTSKKSDLKLKPSAQDIKETLNQKPNAQANVPRQKLTPKDKLANLNKHLETIALPLNYGDHERNVGLHLKKAAPVVVLPLELTDEQKEKVQKEIDSERQRKLQSDREKLEQNKLTLEQKHNAKIIEQERIKEKIQSMLDKKPPGKKNYVSNAPPEMDRTAPVGRKEEEPKKDEESPELKNTNQSLPLKDRSRSKKKKVYYKNITKQTEKISKQQVQFSNFTQREELFTYNNDLQNRNIGFRKVVTKLDAFSKTSRSPSPNMTKKVTPELVNSFSPYNRPGEHVHVNADAPVSPNQTGNLGQNQFKTTGQLNRQQTSDFVLSEAYRSAPLPANKYPFDSHKFPIFNKLDQCDLKDEQSKMDLEAHQNVSELLDEDNEPKVYEYLSQSKSQLSSGCLLKVYKKLFIYADSGKDQNGVKRVLIELYESSTTWQKVNVSISQEIVMTIATIELRNNNFNNAAKVLQSQIFDGVISDPASHEELMKHALTSLGKNIELADYYEKQIDKNIADSFQHLDIAKLFVNITQVLECLNSTNENVRIAKFHNKIITVLQRIKRLNSNLKLKEHDYENLIECFVLNTVRFANKQRNYNLSNFVIGEAIKNKHVDFVRNFNEDERKEYAALIQEFCWHLKDLPNYGTYKDNYIKYLTHAKDILKHCDLNAENLKTSLVINFNRGVFFLKEENYKKAHALFDKCLITYYAFFHEADQDLYIVLFNLGRTLYSKGKYNEAVYFFNRVLDEQCKKNDLKEKSLKKLGFIFFFTEQYKKSMAMFQDYLDNNFERRAPKDFYKCLSVYFVCCERNESDDFQRFFKKLPQLSPNDLDQELYWYFKTFKTIQKIYTEHHNYKENKKYLQMIEEVILGPEGSELAAKRLLTTGGLIFHNFVEISAEKVRDPTESLVKLFHDFYMTVEENSICLAKYINNLTLIFLHSIPLFNERTHNHDFRQKTYEKIRQIVPKHVLADVISRIVKVNARKKENIPDSLFRELKPESSENDNIGRIQKFPSEQILHNPKVAVLDCVCLSEFQKNPVLQGLVKAFLKQVKNLLFLDIVENILTYYLRFEKSLLELGLNYQKYNYIKQLVRFHLSKAPNAQVDKSAFVALLDQLFAGHNICVHDLKLIIVLLEALKDITYLKLFSLYIDQYHPSHAAIAFKSEFYEQFMRKSEGVTKRFFQQINSYKFYELESCYFMHHLDSHNFIHIDKQFEFKLFLRSRHDLLNDQMFRDIFTKYIPSEDLHVFDLKYYLYTTVVKLMKKEDEAPLDILTQFQTRFLDSLTKMGSDEGKMFVMVYEVLLLCNLFKFTAEAQPVEIFINVMNFIIQKFHFNLNFQFSRVLSLMGNIFFKFGHVAKALQVKSQALALMSEDSKVNLAEPGFMVVENKETHFHHILSFVVVCHLELGDVAAAGSILEKMEKMNTADPNIKFNRLILRSLVTLGQNKLTDSLKVIYETIAMFGKMKLNDFLNRMYQAILDKVTLMIIVKTENNSELEAITRKSKTSISRLYELQL